MPATGATDTLFTVQVAAPLPSKGRWKVVIRAPSGEAAAQRLAARGHTVLAVAAGYERPASGMGVTRAIPECVACGYALKDLPAEETLEVTCPECGTVNLGIELPTLESPVSTRKSVRTLRWFLYGFAAIFALGAVLLIVSKF